MRKIVLASGSPRRRELLHQIGLEFEVIPSNRDEKTNSTEPADVVRELSYQKAEDIYSHGHKADIVIGADTIVFANNAILTKPKDVDDCRRMLRELSDDSHHVYTGVTVIWEENGIMQTKSFHEDTKVCVYPMTDQEIDAYIATGDPMDKAGAYGIQGPFAKFIRMIEGDYNNVVGMPVARLYQELKSSGLID